MSFDVSNLYRLYKPGQNSPTGPDNRWSTIKDIGIDHRCIVDVYDSRIHKIAFYQSLRHTTKLIVAMIKILREAVQFMYYLVENSHIYMQLGKILQTQYVEDAS